jgi:hypothetical protein
MRQSTFTFLTAGIKKRWFEEGSRKFSKRKLSEKFGVENDWKNNNKKIKFFAHIQIFKTFEFLRGLIKRKFHKLCHKKN